MRRLVCLGWVVALAWEMSGFRAVARESVDTNVGRASTTERGFSYRNDQRTDPTWSMSSRWTAAGRICS
jgi:hypothetical protein